MDRNIGEHYVDAESQRVTPIELHGRWYNVFENKFDDTWAITHQLPDVDCVESVDTLRKEYEQFLAEIQVLQFLDYELNECTPSVAFWSKDLSG